MIETIKNAWKIPELRKRILFTLLMLLVYRLGSFIAVPFIDKTVLSALVSGNSVLGLFNVISGDNFKNFSIFAMSIQPYITASIILQLLTIAIPALERLSKMGEEGKKKITRYTRYAAIGLALVQALGLAFTLEGFMTNNSWYAVMTVVLVVTAGTSLLVWIGDQITEKGIGNGISLLIFIGIVSGIPGAISTLVTGVIAGNFPIWVAILIVPFVIITVVGVVAVQEGTRKIPITYAKRVVGRKQMGGRNTHLPLKVNQSGVMPVIFAQTIAMAPSTIASFFPNSKFWTGFAGIFSWGSFWTTLIYLVLIIAFGYFYTTISFNPVEVAENIQQYGGYIPGIRPGAPTVIYINKILNRLVFAGGIFLCIISLIPIISGNILGLNIQFGGTSLLIVVSVALETVKQLEQHLIMRNYRGFLK